MLNDNRSNLLQFNDDLWSQVLLLKLPTQRRERKRVFTLIIPDPRLLRRTHQARIHPIVLVQGRSGFSREQQGFRGSIDKGD